MLAFILQHAGLQPGFLIGGVASNFSTSACLGDGEWFVIEADEYDSAFFDKRPKFMHYRPELAILNNLEFDHADIYANLAAIQQQFQYFLRTIPSTGLVLKPRDDEALNEVLARACYSRVQDMALSGKAAWRAELLDEVGRAFRVWHEGECVAEVSWPLIGRFNVENALAAIAASVYAGVSPKDAATALAAFKPVKRRLELKAEHHGVSVYDDFAHHPSAIAKTLAALKASARHQRVLVVLEFASYTMRQGVQAALLEGALATADAVYVLQPKDFSFTEICQHWAYPIHVLASVDAIMDAVCAVAQAGDAILVMSNRGFENIHQRLSERLK
jgi:UDP-N-acetylmuramate: L-alanyl-gamma-D-glutamyl-meso-diaminopimelate ligase